MEIKKKIIMLETKSVIINHEVIELKKDSIHEIKKEVAEKLIESKVAKEYKIKKEKNDENKTIVKEENLIEDNRQREVL